MCPASRKSCRAVLRIVDWKKNWRRNPIHRWSLTGIGSSWIDYTKGTTRFYKIQVVGLPLTGQ